MPSAAVVALWLLAGLALSLTAVRSRRYWGEPGGKPFTVLVASLGLTALGMTVVAVDRTAQLLAGSVLAFVVPVAFALFVFDYTGRFDVGTRDRRLLVATPAAFLAVQHVSFAFVASDVAGIDPWEFDWSHLPAIIDAFPGVVGNLVAAVAIVQFVANLYLWGLVLVGSVVLVSQARRHEHIGGLVGVALVVAGVGPWAVQVVGIMTSEFLALGEELVYVPVGVALLGSGVVLPAVLERRGLFDATPVAGTVGPAKILADMGEPVIVTDHDGSIVTTNPAAEETFEDGACHLGEPITTLVDRDLAALDAAETVDLDAVSGHGLYEPSVSEMTDRHGRRQGYAVVLRDVTDREVRQQRLQVLNRVLRHNLRNDVTAIRGRAELLADGQGEASAIGDAITDSAEDLVDLGDRAREIERMLSVSHGGEPSAPLREVVADVVDDVRARHGDADVDVAVPDDLVVGADERVLEPVVRNLVENAVDHNDRAEPWVRISAAEEEGPLPVSVVVQDDGPGVPENERDALEAGEENPLSHGSGLGLWAVKWGVTRMGGHLSIADNRPRGTVVEVEMPRAAERRGDRTPAEGDVVESDVAEGGDAGSPSEAG